MKVNSSENLNLKKAELNFPHSSVHLQKITS